MAKKPEVSTEEKLTTPTLQELYKEAHPTLQNHILAIETDLHKKLKEIEDLSITIEVLIAKLAKKQ